MKKYYWILGIIAITLMACQKEGDYQNVILNEKGVESPNKPETADSLEMNANFSKITVTAFNSNAVIKANLPQAYTDDAIENISTISLLYKEAESLINGFTVYDKYEIADNQVKFTLRELVPETRYSALLQLTNKYDMTITSNYFEFKTSNYYSEDGKGCSINIESNKGRIAKVRISDIEYVQDSVSVALNRLHFEYRPYNNDSCIEWAQRKFDRVEIADGEVEFEIPDEGEEYLIDGTTYEYIIRMFPDDKLYEPYTLGLGNDFFRFETGFAEQPTR